MSAASPRPYRGVAPEDRQARRRERLLQAVVEVVGGEGWSAATVRRVSTVAGVGPRFVYESFRDTEELATTAYRELGERLVAQALTAIEGRPRGGSSPVDVAGCAIVSILDSLDADPAAARFLLSDGAPFARHRQDLLRRAAGEYTRLALDAGATATPAALTARALVTGGGALELIAARLEGELSMESDVLAALLVRTLTS